jgi:hypothetical protein
MHKQFYLENVKIKTLARGVDVWIKIKELLRNAV